VSVGLGISNVIPGIGRTLHTEDQRACNFANIGKFEFSMTMDIKMSCKFESQ
jgi:hypothetical protein